MNNPGPLLSIAGLEPPARPSDADVALFRGRDVPGDRKSRTRPGTGRNARFWPVLCAFLSVLPFSALLSMDARVIPSNDACDYEFFQVPVREFAREEILAGRFPHWIPYLGCGMPLHAGGQASLTYPFLMPFVVLLGANAGIKLSLWLHLLLAFLGQYVLRRTLRLSRVAASFAALVTAQSAFVVSHLMEGHVTMVLAYALLPWLLAAVIGLTRTPGLRSAAFASAVVALLLLSGHPQITYYGILFGGAWALASLATGAAARHRCRTLTWSAVAAAVAFLLAGVQVLPTLELTQDGIGDSVRGTRDYSASFSLSPLEVVRFLVSNGLGNSLRDLPEFRGFDFIHERIGYLGIGTLLLAYFALTRRSARSWEFGAAGLCVAALILSLGNWTAAYRLMALVPGFYLFRCPARLFCIISVLLPLVAGRGFDAILRQRSEAEPNDSRRQFWRRRIQSVLLVFFAVIVLDHLRQVGPAELVRFATQNVPFEWTFAFALVTVTLFELYAARRIAPRSVPRAASLMLAITAIDLAAGSAFMFRLVDEPRTSAPASVVSDAGGFRFVDINEPPSPTEGSIRYSKLVPVAVRERFPMIGTNEGGVVSGSLERLQRAVLEQGDTVLPAAACAYACVSRSRWTKLPGALPRIRFLPGDRSELAGIPIEEFDPADWPASDSRLEIHEEHANRIELDADAPGAGRLVIADLWYPGWTCSVDGREVAIERVHGIFRGIPLEAGPHRIEMVFRPASFLWGALASAAGLAVWTALVVRRIPFSGLYSICRKAQLARRERAPESGPCSFFSESEAWSCSLSAGTAPLGRLSERRLLHTTRTNRRRTQSPRSRFRVDSGRRGNSRLPFLEST